MSNHMVSYFGSDLEVMPDHLAEIAAHGAKSVVLCVSERLARYHRQGVIESVKLAHAAGLDCLIDFWGAFGIFGGEEFSGFLASGGRACLHEAGFRAAMADQIALAEAAGANGIFWDEPHMSCGTPSGGSCCSTVEFLAWVTAFARAKRLYSVVNIPPLPENWRVLERAAGLSTVDMFGSNLYYDIPGYKHKYDPPEVHVPHVSRFLQQLTARHGKPNQLWLQGHKQVELAGYEHVHLSEWNANLARLARQEGITNFAFWSFRANAGLSSLWPHGDYLQCQPVWQSVKEIFLDQLAKAGDSNVRIRRSA